ncbi:NADPH-dependent aldehyde reductase Ahr [Paraburkholderia solisilvae]|uniref:alcohol dehydrogenase (NADP(+)) n=1 Tax=Paraburkholderia solisilvae TaxID=624376 RepID=A0A6J5DDT1_9BURK|nr:NAD(P)-dependent alcohol dehydrogenase [Paraburkholderia solisilvae]CAB3752113.1 Aldehyde reductase Ahr [Paraburkholderia solisilvae]
MTTVNAYAVSQPKGRLVPFQYELGPLAASQIDIRVESCALCHSDLSMIDNEWGISSYPLVPGHEVIGTIAAVGANVTTLAVGQRVGLGWFSSSCMHCRQCMRGDHNLCPSAESTIIGRFGGFADRIRCHSSWAIALPSGVDADSAGPLFCGGITVFNPIVQFDVKPTHKVGVIGIGGLGHLALQFLNRWGCEVTAFTSSASKTEEARRLGAHHVIDSGDSKRMQALAGQFDFILNTTNVSLDWPTYLNALAPRGRLHTVGVVTEPIGVPGLLMNLGQRSLSGSPIGSPATVDDMLQFCARHQINPLIEQFPMSQLNEAFDRLRSGAARYRVVARNDM